MSRLVLVFLLATGLGAAAQTPAHAARGLRTAIVTNTGLSEANDEIQFKRIKAAGALAVRIPLSWAQVAPRRVPRGFAAADPEDAAYDWSAVDRHVRLAHEEGLDPILIAYDAPRWAQAEVPQGVLHPSIDGPYRPSPAKFGIFARAAARRYSGSFRTEDEDRLPRVRYWIAWNEPNIYRYLTPQNLNDKPFSPEWYRRMVNSFSSAVHSIHSDNVVIAGATAPFGIDRRISPLKFMREMLCMSAGTRPRPTCSHRASFDVWSHHPYTRGDAFHHAYSPDDVSLGDLPEMRELVNAAQRAHHIVSRRKVGFWVDEFGWDSRPPNRSPYTVPAALDARWTSEALYQMWRSGVTTATWFLLRDEPVRTSVNQTGLWYIGSPPQNLRRDRPKPSLQAFRFPFVVYLDGTRISIWGRTPTSTGGKVAIDARLPSGWRRVGILNAGGNGVFVGTVGFSPIASGASDPASAFLRARFEDQASRAFSLKRPLDRFVLPFA
jgi:hypothetical protein